MAAVLLSRAFRLPCVCHARGSDVNVYPWESRANFLLTRHVIENCDAPVACSGDLAEKMSSMSRNRREVAVLYKGVDTQLFSPASGRSRLRQEFGMRERPFVALYVGTVSQEKGLEELARAWTRVERALPGSLLVIVGLGPVLRRFVPMGAKVLLCGARPSSEVARWMQASDVLVLPSHSEGMPNVILEAMACELPIVATLVGGIPEAVVHSETGLLVPVGDWQGLASAILALAENRDRRLSMGKAGRKRIETLFRWENYASQAQRLYRSLL
jgi:glycosyltransferase involved in cell wall biosynthesis